MIKHSGTKRLETGRLILRRMKESDAEELHNGYVNQEEFLYYANKQKVTLEEEKRYLAGIDERYRDDEYYNWVITLKETDAIIGSVNLRVNNSKASVEFNYAIDNRYTNNGYMTEALARVKEYCFEELGVERFHGACCIENTASKRVMEKCGMNLEEVLVSHIGLEDGCHDAYMFAVTKSNAPN